MGKRMGGGEEEEEEEELPLHVIIGVTVLRHVRYDIFEIQCVFLSELNLTRNNSKNRSGYGACSAPKYSRSNSDYFEKT
jgi:hypothetical protein